MKMMFASKAAREFAELHGIESFDYRFATGCDLRIRKQDLIDLLNSDPDYYRSMNTPYENLMEIVNEKAAPVREIAQEDFPVPKRQCIRKTINNIKRTFSEIQAEMDDLLNKIQKM